MFSRASGILKGGWVVYREEGRTSLVVDTFIHDAVNPCSYGFLKLSPCVHGAVKIMR